MEDQQTIDPVEVRRYPTFAEAEQHSLVLTAVGIASSLRPAGGGVAIFVRASDAERARHQLALYDRENAPDGRPPLRLRRDGHGLEAALGYMAVLMFFFAAQRRAAFDIDWIAAGAARSDAILDGAWWRAFTALALHADPAHLIANLAFGVICGLLLAPLLGTGAGWLGIVLAGGLGNALNAVFQPAGHAAIGASTAVFGGLGLLAGYVQLARPPGWRRGLRRWAPVAAGVMLLAFLGFGGGRTDVGAHVAGFAVGGGLGFVLAWSRPVWLHARRTQRLSGAAACGLVALAWAVALAA